MNVKERSTDKNGDKSEYSTSLKEPEEIEFFLLEVD